MWILSPPRIRKHWQKKRYNLFLKCTLISPSVPFSSAYSWSADSSPSPLRTGSRSLWRACGNIRVKVIGGQETGPITTPPLDKTAPAGSLRLCLWHQLPFTFSEFTPGPLLQSLHHCVQTTLRHSVKLRRRKTEKQTERGKWGGSSDVWVGN